MNDCDAPLHPQAAAGIRLFNAGEYFEAHEALEDAWKQERGAVRDLYRGILQVAVVYLHLTRRNYAGAVKVYERSKKWLKDWPAECRGVQVAQLRKNVERVMAQVKKMPSEEAPEFDTSLLKPVKWKEEAGNKEHLYICDRCGHEMYEKNCKVICPNCGNQFDCSDLNLYFD